MVVSRPSLFACLVWPFIGLVALAILVGSGGDPVGLVIGGFMAAVFLFGVAVLVRTRVEVDGVELRRRKLLRVATPVRLDRLAAVRAVRGSRGLGWQFLLSDRDGTTVRIDAVNFSVARLWPVLAVALSPDRVVGEDRDRARRLAARLREDGVPAERIEAMVADLGPSVDREAAKRIERARAEHPSWPTASGLPELT